MQRMKHSRRTAWGTRVRCSALVAAIMVAVALLRWTVPVLAADLRPAVQGTAAAWGAVYSATDLAQELARDPARWLGQEMRVRAAIVGTLRWVRRSSGRQDILLTGLHLSDPGTASAAAALPLVPGPDDPVLAAVRRLPLLGQMVPPRQAWRPHPPAIYWIQLRTLPATACRACVEAVLLDAE